jgi:hypothetical protein
MDLDPVSVRFPSGDGTMSDTQLWIAVGIPTVTVLVGILLNALGVSRVESRLQVIEGDLRGFYQMLGEHSAKIENLEKK